VEDTRPDARKVINTETGDVKIYETTLDDLIPQFVSAEKHGIIYQPAKLKTTMGTLADEKNFKKRDANNAQDNGVYSSTKAKLGLLKEVGCDPVCLDAKELTGSGNFKVISETRACERNSEGIRRYFGRPGFTLEECKNSCGDGCAAIDYYRSTWCNRFSKACTNPQSTHDGPSSYRKLSKEEVAEAQAQTGGLIPARLKNPLMKNKGRTCTHYRNTAGFCVKNVTGTDCTGCAKAYSNGPQLQVMLRQNKGPGYVNPGIAGHSHYWTNKKGLGVEACAKLILNTSVCAMDYFTYVDRGDKNCGCKRGTSTEALEIRDDLRGDIYKLSAYAPKNEDGSPVSPMQLVRALKGKGFVRTGIASPWEHWFRKYRIGVEACAKLALADTRCKDYFTYVARGDQNCGCRYGSGELQVRGDHNGDIYSMNAFRT